MKNLSNILHKTFKALDLFPTSNFLRYSGEKQYTTVTGGVISAAIIVIFAVLFASMGIRTINRQIIQASTNVFNDPNPTPLSLITSPNKNFMFSIILDKINLNNEAQKLFDITLWQVFYSAGFIVINKTSVPLVQCTAQHYAFNQDIKSTALKANISNGLCPPIGYQLLVSGKAISDVSSSFYVSVNRCNQNQTKGCVNDTVFSTIQATFQYFTLCIPIVNFQINPSDSDYKEIFIEDRNALSFNSQMGVSATAYVQQIIVNTDINIFPFQKIVQERFPAISNLFTVLPYLKTSSKPYAFITFNKARTTTTYTRSFNKLDSYFSYIGGIIGTFLTLMLIVRCYTQKAYQISISHKLFKNSDNSQIPQNFFNIFYFFGMAIQKLLNLFKCNIKWQKTQQFLQCCEQVSFQLDVTYMIRKLMFLESAVEILFEKHQVEALYFREKPQIQRIRYKRRKYFNPELVGKQLTKLNQNSERKDSSPKNINQQQMKEADHYSACDKLSNLSSFSVKQKNNQLQEILSCISKVLKQSKQGNIISGKILNQVNQSFFFPQIWKTQDYQMHVINKKEQQIEIKCSQIQVSPELMKRKRLSKRGGFINQANDCQ